MSDTRPSKILVSACLIGRPVRYDGRAKTLESDWITRWSQAGMLVPLCPETAAGFAVPRAPAEIEPVFDGSDVLAGAARIIDSLGHDQTSGFTRGAKLAVEIAAREGCHYALLTDGSPSCGSLTIYSGRHDGEKRAGQGVVAAALTQAGVTVFAPEQIEELAKPITQERPG